MGTGCATARTCEECEALIKAQRAQIVARRHRMAKMAAELKEAKREYDEARAELAAYREKVEAESDELRRRMASLQAWAKRAHLGLQATPDAPRRSNLASVLLQAVAARAAAGAPVREAARRPGCAPRAAPSGGKE